MVVQHWFNDGMVRYHRTSLTRIHPKSEWPQWKDIGREENIGKSVNEHFTLISSPSGETNPLPNWMMCDNRNGRKRRLCVGTSKCIKNRHVVLLEQLSPYHNWYQLSNITSRSVWSVVFTTQSNPYHFQHASNEMIFLKRWIKTGIFVTITTLCEVNWNMEVHNMPKRIWYFCAQLARNVTRHQKDRHLSSPENSHRRKSESELQRRTGQGFPDNDLRPNVQCGWTFHHSPYQLKMIKRHISSPHCRWITAQITVDLYGGTVSIVQHFLYTKISVQCKMLARERTQFRFKWNSRMKMIGDLASSTRVDDCCETNFSYGGSV